MITDAQYQQWLLSPDADRVVLIDLYHADGVVFVSDKPFISRHDDAQPNRVYLDCLNESLDATISADSKLTLGEVSLVDDGAITAWINYKWRGFKVEFRLGDRTWPLNDFRLVGKQTNAGISSARTGVIRFDVTDSAVLLEQPITRRLINGVPAPLILGNTFGGSALRESTNNLEYSASELPLQAITVRDGNGGVMTTTNDLAAGKFTLATYTPRAVFVECQEQHNTPHAVLTWLCGYYSITLATQVSELPSYVVGLRYDEDVSGVQILDDIARTIGGFWYLDVLGALHMKVYKDPANLTPDAVLDADDIEQGEVELVRHLEPIRAMTIKYGQNHSPITEVAGSINSLNPTLAQRLANEWSSQTNERTLPNYPLATVERVDTALVGMPSALVEVNNRLGFRTEKRDVYRFKGWVTSAVFTVGMVVQVNHARLNGRKGLILSVAQSLGKDSVELEVLF